jgi:hypothetical protein
MMRQALTSSSIASCSHQTLLTLTGNWPKYENYHILQNFYKEYVLLLLMRSCRSAVDRFEMVDCQLNQSICASVI